jgi:hypothetical protein
MSENKGLRRKQGSNNNLGRYAYITMNSTHYVLVSLGELMQIIGFECVDKGEEEIIHHLVGRHHMNLPLGPPKRDE